MLPTASKAEREYVGLNNGILDQACVVLCEADKLLYLDTETGKHELLPFGKGDQPLPFRIGVFFSDFAAAREVPSPPRTTTQPTPRSSISLADSMVSAMLASNRKSSTSISQQGILSSSSWY